MTADLRERSLGIALILVQLAVSGVTVAIVALRTMYVDRCGETCNFPLVTVAFFGLVVASILLLVLSAILIILRSNKSKPTWWAPVGAIAVQALLTLGAVILIELATH